MDGGVNNMAQLVQQKIPGDVNSVAGPAVIRHLN